jgi:hypothetical protein
MHPNASSPCYPLPMTLNLNSERKWPLIAELPKLLNGVDWNWDRPSDSSRIPKEFWIGTDRKGGQWLVKMRGSFLAQREYVFATIAQRIGISCQSSVYLVIPSKTALPRGDQWNSEPHQLALYLLPEHSRRPCSSKCPLQKIADKSLNYSDIEAGETSGILNFKDLIRGEALGYLCGQFEPYGDFFTDDHRYVVIDNECMFAERCALVWCNRSSSDKSFLRGGRSDTLRKCAQDGPRKLWN